MESKGFRDIEKKSLENGNKASKDYIETGALAALKAAATAYNTALRASITELMYKKQEKDESNN